MRACAPLLLAAAAVLAVPSGIVAQTERRSAEAADLIREVDAAWIGGHRGGYWPVRITLTNDGPARAVTAAFLPYGAANRPQRPPVVTRTDALPAGGTVSYTLPLPLTGGRRGGELAFLADPLPDSGEVPNVRRDEDDFVRGAIPDLSYQLTLPSASDEAINRPALLIAADAAPEMTGFEEACAALTGAVAADSSRPKWRDDVAVEKETFAAVPPELWPETWLGFTSVDIVAVTPESLVRLSPAARAALTTWLHAGGTVIVPNAGDPRAPGNAADLGRLLDLDSTAAAGEWAEVSVNGAEPLREAATNYLGRRLGGFLSGFISGKVQFPVPPAAGGPILAKPVLAGRVYALGGGDVAGPTGKLGWEAILKNLGPERWSVADRLGVYPRGPNREFYEWLIPGVRGVPVAGFVVLMTLFALVIGPANYVWLKRKHRIGRLAVTIPLIAAATGGVLLAYSLVMHGFGVKARQLAVTVHDPGADRAVTFARTAVFAPRGDDAGLAFDPSVAVFRLPSPDGDVSDGRVDWTDRQRWRGGFFRGRTRTQFVTVEPRPERGRLTAEPSPAGLRVTNGYDADFAALLVTDAAGTMFYGRDVPAGGEAALRPITGDDQFAWRQALDGRLPEAPPGLEGDGLGVLGVIEEVLGRRRRTGASFRESLAMRSLAALRGLNEKTDPLDAFLETPLLPRIDGAFVAVLEEGETGTFGGLEVDFRGGLHVLAGVIDGEVPGPAGSAAAAAGATE